MKWGDCNTVYCGFWVNWSHSESIGATLTLPSAWGLILISFIAIIIKIASENLWRALSFIVHQLNSSSLPKDDVYHQIQLLLRNAETESSFILSLVKVWNAHKGVRLQILGRYGALLLLAVAHGVGFFAASALSSRLIAAEDPFILTVSKSCGWLDEPALESLANPEAFEAFNALAVMSRSGFRRSAAYARSCYAKYGGETTSCGSYVKESIRFNTSREVHCPFGDDICNGTAIEFDSGYLRSDLHLGINTHVEDSISFRKVLSCAPLAADKYTDGWQVPPENLTAMFKYPLGTMYQAWSFGQSTVMAPPLNNTNITFLADTTSLDYGQIPFDLSYVSDFPFTTRPDQAAIFSPIPALASDTSDLNLISLQTRVLYRDPVHDPWFSAENCTTQDLNFYESTFCQASKGLTFLACQERYEICSHDHKSCSPVTALYPLQPANASSASDPPKAFQKRLTSATQSAVYALIWKILWSAQLNFQLGFIGNENLIANDYLWDGGGFELGQAATLPANQWQIEVENWMNVTLAAMQARAVTFARPPEFEVNGGFSSLKHIIPPEGKEMKGLCRKILARSSSHMSFSVAGLFGTIGVCIIFVLVNLLLPSIVAKIQRRAGRGGHKMLEWMESSYFQLQRMAAEGRGIGPWMGLEKDVPVMEERERLFSLKSRGLGNGYEAIEGAEVVQHGVVKGV
ncbi:hypothetical protein BDV96DRAFT_641351 [Lophiotrema nucula]|uniref:Uncharacterized protein n=1 Tax=Lophiotrema nucula TaxID=690887 RepID=A0A6A5ZMQ8_9PLEO|nr:hypothetical protein BDV96DRAFT_641351 [Lophiotrema nucula]